MGCCKDVRRVIYFYLDGSLGETKFRDLAAHFALCPECEQRRQVQLRLREFVRHRIVRVEASQQFKTRLTRSLRGLHAEI